jgi:hypothetical protein
VEASGGRTPAEFARPAIWRLTLREWSRPVRHRHTCPLDPVARLRSVGDRLVPSVEALAQAVAERAVELVVSALDMNALLDRVDVNAVLDEIDVDRVLARVDVNAALEHVDLDGLLDRVGHGSPPRAGGPEPLAARLDLDRLLATVNVNRLVGTVDITAIVQQVDVDAVIQKVDLEAVTDRLDMNAIVQRVDVDALVQQTDLAAIIARSSGGIAGGALDVARSQAVGPTSSSPGGPRGFGAAPTPGHLARWTA